jgi:hypothetical protein
MWTNKSAGKEHNIFSLSEIESRCALKAALTFPGSNAIKAADPATTRSSLFWEDLPDTFRMVRQPLQRFANCNI